MQKIEFRGKRIDNDKWIYGYYWVAPDLKKTCFIRTKISDTHNADYEVIPETVGQYINLEDNSNNKVKIYKDDILAMNGDKNNAKYLVSCNVKHCCFGLYQITFINDEYILGFQLLGIQSLSSFIQNNNLIVIGNKFDSPELLEEKICKK